MKGAMQMTSERVCAAHGIAASPKSSSRPSGTSFGHRIHASIQARPNSPLHLAAGSFVSFITLYRGVAALLQLLTTVLVLAATLYVGYEMLTVWFGYSFFI
jgi:hypothetical protein